MQTNESDSLQYPYEVSLSEFKCFQFVQIDSFAYSNESKIEINYFPPNLYSIFNESTASADSSFKPNKADILGSIT